MDVAHVYHSIISDVNVQAGLAFIQSDNENTLADQIAITEIPAPTFHEQIRGAYYKKRLEEMGLIDVHADEAGNVYGTRPGSGSGPKLMVSSHLDTVFPENTDVTVRNVNGTYFGPGLADNGRGLAVLLSLARAFRQSGIDTVGDIVFCSTVGEEGLGDLCGVKAVFRDGHDIDGFISIEPDIPSRIVYTGVGSRRYNVTYRGPGGHSFGAFGTPSAIHALGRAVAQISNLQTCKDPKTTFTVGTIHGGTSVNTIAAEANMLIDMRSSSPDELAKLEAQVMVILDEAVKEENERWGWSDVITVEMKLVGNRPAGAQSVDSVIVQAAMASVRELGFEPLLDTPGSTDSNVPISLGIPAVTLGGGGASGGLHTLGEWFEPADAYFGVQNLFLTTLGLVGMQSKFAPLLKGE